jgi:hypothetical protein
MTCLSSTYRQSQRYPKSTGASLATPSIAKCIRQECHLRSRLRWGSSRTHWPGVRSALCRFDGRRETMPSPTPVLEKRKVSILLKESLNPDPAAAQRKQVGGGGRPTLSTTDWGQVYQAMSSAMEPIPVTNPSHFRMPHEFLQPLWAAASHRPSKRFLSVLGFSGQVLRDPSSGEPCST